MEERALVERLYTIAEEISDILTRLGGAHQRPPPLTSQDRRQLSEDVERTLRELRALCADLGAAAAATAATAPPPPKDPLTAVSRAQTAVEQARTELQSAVDLARAEGASWRRVGEMLGITGQSAHKRFDSAARRRHADYMRERDQRLRSRVV